LTANNFLNAAADDDDVTVSVVLKLTGSGRRFDSDS